MTTDRTTRLVIFAPNWLGDAVMALPALADIRRARPDVTIAVAARPAVAPLFHLVADVDHVVLMAPGAWHHPGPELAEGGFEIAILLPNSLHVAMVASRAGIPERWGYRADCRGRLLTRAVDRPRGLHQARYYQELTRVLGFPSGPVEPRIAVSPDARAGAAALLTKSGWDGRAPLVAIAPGAAYGGAKRWPPERFTALVEAFAADGVQTVMIGGAADAETAARVEKELEARAALHNLVGRTDLATLAGVFTACRTLVTNDSGAMHLAAAIGTPVTAVFGPTDDRATRPLGPSHTVIARDVWCRPCLLRECPLDHACMRGIEVGPVLEIARAKARA